MCLKVQNDKKTNQSQACPTRFDHCRDLFRGELTGPFYPLLSPIINQ